MRHLQSINEFFGWAKKKKIPFDYDFKGLVDIKLISNSIKTQMNLDPNIQKDCLDLFYNNGFNYCSIGGISSYMDSSEIVNFFNKLKLLNKDDLVYKLSSIAQIAIDGDCDVKSGWVKTKIIMGTTIRRGVREFGVEIYIRANSIVLKDLMDYMENSAI